MIIFRLATIFCLLFVCGCSTQKDAALNRVYHQLNTKYNALFYAKEHLKTGVKKITELHTDNYKEILSIKGKSNEGLGYIGRKEGIAVFSNTTINFFIISIITINTINITTIHIYTYMLTQLHTDMLACLHIYMLTYLQTFIFTYYVHIYILHVIFIFFT